MRSLLPLLALAACGAPSQRELRAPEKLPPRETPKRVHTMQPHELIVQGVPAAGVQRARLARHGPARFRRDLPSVTSAGWQAPELEIYAVAEVDGDDVRVVHDDDDARLLVWIARADLARVTTREVTPRDGVVLAPGTPVGTQRDVAFEGLVIPGVIEEDAIGALWDAAPPIAGTDDDRLVEAGVAITDGPSEDARLLATTTERLHVHTDGDVDGWTELTTMGPYVRVHGYVPSAQTSGDVFGTGSGRGYGASHTIDVEMPAGACLYDAIGGEMIGVNVIARTRMAEKDDDGWYYVLVNSPWALLRVPAHQTDGAFDTCMVAP